MSNIYITDICQPEYETKYVRTQQSSKGKKEYVCWFLFIGRRVSYHFSCILVKTIFLSDDTIVG